jgi:hypothetical protein
MAKAYESTEFPIPELKTLWLATGVAILIALAVLVLAVLPAEYGIDPTGVGRKLGLTALVANSSASKPQVFSCQQQLATWRDVVAISIPAHQGLEYKFKLAKEGVFKYSWTTQGVPLYFDFHGEPEGDTSGYFKSYQETTADHAAGELVAPFLGAHGWYWENKSAHPVTVLLSTQGEYQVLGLR